MEKKENEYHISQSSFCNLTIAHSDDITVPTQPVYLLYSYSTSSDGDSNEDNLDYQPENSQLRHIISQVELNDLVRDLTKGQSELLASRLQEWNLLEDETKVNLAQWAFWGVKWK